MKVYSIKRKQILPVDIRTAWNFFSSPKNLSKITPKKMNFEIIHYTGENIFCGQIIQYRVNVMPFVRLGWTTEITQVNEPFEFSDEQKAGPYTHWLHKHSFREVAEGVEMTDEVSYSIPFGWVGRLANWIFVAREVNAIFDYRYNVLTDMFGTRVNTMVK